MNCCQFYSQASACPSDKAQYGYLITPVVQELQPDLAEENNCLHCKTAVPNLFLLTYPQRIFQTTHFQFRSPILVNNFSKHNTLNNFHTFKKKAWTGHFLKSVILVNPKSNVNHLYPLRFLMYPPGVRAPKDGNRCFKLNS